MASKYVMSSLPGASPRFLGVLRRAEAGPLDASATYLAAADGRIPAFEQWAPQSIDQDSMGTDHLRIPFHGGRGKNHRWSSKLAL